MIELDASLIISAYNKGIEDAIQSLVDFHDLDEALKEKGIDGNEPI